MKKWIFFLLGAIIFISGLLWLELRKTFVSDSNQSVIQFKGNQQKNSGNNTATKGWKVYRDEKSGISFSYPASVNTFGAPNSKVEVLDVDLSTFFGGYYKQFKNCVLIGHNGLIYKIGFVGLSVCTFEFDSGHDIYLESRKEWVRNEPGFEELIIDGRDAIKYQNNYYIPEEIVEIDGGNKIIKLVNTGGFLESDVFFEVVRSISFAK